MRRKQDDPDYLQLQAEWDQKLRDSGFKDHECRKSGALKSWTGSSPLIDDNPPLPGWGRLSHSPSAKSKRDAAGYYRMAGAFLHKRRFKSQRERMTWWLHSEGTSNRKIAARLGTTTAKVKVILKRLKRAMFA